MEFDIIHFSLFVGFVYLLYIHFVQPPAEVTDAPRDAADSGLQPHLLHPEQFIDFLMIVGRLKEEKRTGWVNSKVQGAESVADHMYRMAVMSMFFRDGDVDPYKTMKIALVHDIAEALVGDITPPESSGVSVEEKHAKEDAAFAHISSLLLLDRNQPNTGANANLSRELESYYADYSRQSSPEGRLCKQFDKLEMIIQAYEYELQQDVCLDTFFESTMSAFKHPYLQQVHQVLLERRQKLKASKATQSQ